MGRNIDIEKFVKNIKNSHLCIFCILILLLGLPLNSYADIRFPLVHEIILIGLICSQTMIIKKHLLDMNNLYSTTTNTMILGCIKRYYCRQKSIVPVFFILSLVILFSSFIISLNYLPKSPLGVYGGVVALITLIIGLYGYYQYILVILLLFDISNRIDYSLEFPCIQNWFGELNHLSYRLSKSFLIFGVFYMIEYSLLIPPNSLQINETKIILNTYNNVIFIFSWLSVIILIAFAFPILVIIRKHFLKIIIVKWQNDNITHMQLNVIRSTTILSKNEDSGSIEKTLCIIKIYQQTKKIIESLSTHSITSNTITLSITTFLNILISILTACSQLKELIE